MKLGKKATPRTDQMKDDYNQFQLDGADIKRTKYFHNVIDLPLFNVPITQVLNL